METQISSDNPGTAAADNPNAGHAAEPNGTAQVNGQPGGQSGHVEDVFEGIDPKKLPPELRPHLDNMVRIYREKTEKLSETVKSETAKAVEAFKAKAEFYDAFTKDDNLVKYYNDYVRQLNAKSQPANPDDPTAKLAREIEEIKQAREVDAAKEFINAFADAVDDKGAKINPDFEELNGYVLGEAKGQSGKETYSLLRACVELAPGNTPQEKLSNGYKAAQSLKAAIFEAGKKAGMGRVQEKVRNGTFAPSSLNNATGMAPRVAKNGMEALEFAKRGLRPFTPE